MRVLHVNHTLDPVRGGGTAVRTASLCRALATLGAATSVLTLDLGLNDRVRIGMGDTEVVALRCLNERLYIPEPARDRIRSAVAAVDVVHLSGHWTVLNALAFQAARRLGTPHVVTPAGALPLFGRSVNLKRAYNVVLGTRTVQTAAAHVAITEAERQQFTEYGVSPESVAVIPNGVWAEEFAEPDQLACAELWSRLGRDRRPFILFMGRLNPIKGPDLLLSAFARVSTLLGDIRLVVAGPDEGMGASLRAQVDAAGLHNRVVFLGPVEGAVKVAAYHMAQLLVVPSRREAMSLVALEAGASGTPVLLTDACGFAVDSLEGGLVVPPTVPGLANGLVNLLSDSEGLPRMGQRLQHAVCHEYSWESAAGAHLSLYRTVITRSHTPSSLGDCHEQR